MDPPVALSKAAKVAIRVIRKRHLPFVIPYIIADLKVAGLAI